MVIQVEIVPLVTKNSNDGKHWDYRPTCTALRSHDDENFVILGRNSTSGIKDTEIRRNVLKIEIDDEDLVKAQNLESTAHNNSSGHTPTSVHINRMKLPRQSTAVLNNNDVIALSNEHHPEHFRYEFQIYISKDGKPFSRTTLTSNSTSPCEGFLDCPSEEQQEGEPVSKKLSQATAAARTVSATRNSDDDDDENFDLSMFSDQISEEITCSVCLDIMVYPQTVSPCGHSFCGQCLIDTIKECPHCRAKVQSKVHSRHLESLITTLTTIPTLLNNDDIKHYHDRMKKESSKGFVDCSSKSSRRRPSTTSRTAGGGASSSSSRRARQRRRTNDYFQQDHAAVLTGTSHHHSYNSRSTSSRARYDPTLMQAPLPPPFEYDDSAPMFGYDQHERSQQLQVQDGSLTSSSNINLAAGSSTSRTAAEAVTAPRHGRYGRGRDFQQPQPPVQLRGSGDIGDPICIDSD